MRIIICFVAIIFLRHINAQTKTIEIYDDASLKESLSALDNNTTLILKAGTYHEEIVVKNKYNISIIAKPNEKVFLDARKKAPKIRLIRADLYECKEAPHLPSCEWRPQCDCDWIPIYPQTKNQEATLQILNSQNIRIQGLHFINAFPTHLSIQNSQNISVRENHFYRGTFAIHASGERTQALTLLKNTWVQDESREHRLWNIYDWTHAHHGLLNYFNGAFFGSTNIAGNVKIASNKVRDAFNVIRMNFKPLLCQYRDCALRINKDVTIINNQFERIRDNVVEPEWIANGKWIIAYNTIRNAHADISLDNVHNSDKKGIFLLYQNTFIKTSRPSMGLIHTRRVGTNNGGKILKLPKGPIAIYTQDGTIHYKLPYLNLILQKNFIDTYQDRHDYNTSILKGSLPRGTDIRRWGNNQLQGVCRLRSIDQNHTQDHICRCIEQTPLTVYRPPT